MTTTTNLTTAETQAIVYAARRVVGTAWEYLDSDTLKGKLTEAIADQHNDRLEVLLALVDGVRYDLCDESGDTIRKATIAEAVTSLMLGPEGFVTVGGQTRYVDFS